MCPTASQIAERPRTRQMRAARETGLTLLFHDRRRLVDGTLTGAEAQLRWPSPRAGTVFGPALDESAMAVDAVAALLSNTCRQAVTVTDGLVSVTVPDWFLRSGTLLEAAAQALDATGLDPERLELAIAEAGLDSHCTDTLLAMSALRDLGVGLAMDGFGRRDASLLALKRLPLTALKLDGGLAADALYDPGARALISATSGFAHKLDMIVVAAAPQEDALLGILRQSGCDETVARTMQTRAASAVGGYAAAGAHGFI